MHCYICDAPASAFCGRCRRAYCVQHSASMPGYCVHCQWWGRLRRLLGCGTTSITALLVIIGVLVLAIICFVVMAILLGTCQAMQEVLSTPMVFPTP